MTVLVKPRPFLDVQIGGSDDVRLWFQRLRDAGAGISDYSKRSFLATSFVRQSQVESITLGRITVAEYGFPHGVGYRALLEQGHARGEVLNWEAVLPACHAYDTHPKGERLHMLTDPAPLGRNFDGILMLYRPSSIRAVHFRDITRDSFFEPHEELIVRIP